MHHVIPVFVANCTYRGDDVYPTSAGVSKCLVRMAQIRVNSLSAVLLWHVYTLRRCDCLYSIRSKIFRSVYVPGRKLVTMVQRSGTHRGSLSIETMEWIRITSRIRLPKIPHCSRISLSSVGSSYHIKMPNSVTHKSLATCINLITELTPLEAAKSHKLQ